jgi:hypothetical protein
LTALQTSARSGLAGLFGRLRGRPAGAERYPASLFAMYQVDDRDRVIELSEVPQSSVGAPLPVVLSDEHTLLLAYLVQEPTSSWDHMSVRLVGPDTLIERLALVEFSRYQSFMFGSPNDEAFNGHPLYSRGLHPYAAFEIQNSSWVRQLERMNSVHPSHRAERFQRLKHFVFAFHDSTFECLAETYVISDHEGSLELLLPEMQRRLRW